MATYKYTTENGGDIVSYNITPDFGTFIYPYDTITIDGQFKPTTHAVQAFSIDTAYYFDNGDSPINLYLAHKTPLSIPVNKTGTFSIKARLDEQNQSDTISKLPHRYEKFGINFYLYDDSESSVSAFAFLPSDMDYEERKAIFAKYTLSPQISGLDFERATETGEWADDGLYLRCKTLKISINPAASVDDITIAKLTCTGTDESSQVIELTKEQLTQALSPDGYQEDKATLFNFASALGITYTITLAFGDEYESAFSTDTVLRSFARIHFAGASTGGCAIGMFSSATEGHPKFEVAEDHQSHLYGGLWDGKGYRMDYVERTELIDISSSNFEPWSETILPMISRIGPIVFLEGALKCTVETNVSSGNHTICTLPSWAWPRMRISQINQGNGTNIYWLIIDPDGKVLVTRHRSGTTYNNITVNSSLLFTACWLAADAAPALPTYTSDNSLLPESF